LIIEMGGPDLTPDSFNPLTRSPLTIAFTGCVGRKTA
jgi:hypothetical protein